MHYFTPKCCEPSQKIMYKDKITALQAAEQSRLERGAELWVYRCEFCGTWHLTHRDPQLNYMRTQRALQRKPHSRKRGFKPRHR
ncbi:hypothetical protein [Bifidobacterium pseudolongum]|uniref:Uncharacterized protein n=1 Tax=Bifidobacterium pseudolongum subsp. globosum TaxID=1690 RepID=A0A4Q5APF0_9BIFI|nr:hypothetical protein [Bifidobacterium pseudolongum]MCH4852190.1 hypothetical protein [Bifidobacterium pseudolongum]RYQ29728.1 hypothetical protein PG2009B_1711 [Bifidobacterium pseudolongum subsp. globosum]RYQ34444.1 hypothetical protein PG2003B_1711 [Bifidobacterium pseudolongum subsp. globosum]RYQ71274.1 hypothetical protein PG2012B_1724 [Bifidobacterium pseudolongum subsp. globosum]